MWTDLEINLAIFTMNKWQSIILLWNKCKFWDFSIVPMTWNLKHVEACSVFCAAATRNKICYQTQQAIFNAKFPAEDCFQALSWKVLRFFKNILLLLNYIKLHYSPATALRNETLIHHNRTIMIVLSCFYLLISHFENFSTPVSHFPFAIKTLILSLCVNAILCILGNRYCWHKDRGCCC